MKRRITAAVLAFSLFCTGCGVDRAVVIPNQEYVEISLSWWGNDARTEYTLAAVQEFERLHPGIKVDCSYSEWSGYEARSQVQMFSDTEADVMQINFGWLPQYSPDGTGYYDIESVSDFIDLSNFSDDMLEYGRRNGTLNAIPIAMNAETVYINKTVYDKYGLDVPKTWDDLFNAAKVMKKDGVYPIAGVSKSIWLYTITYAEQVTGKDFLREDGTLNFNADELQIMLEFYDRMIDEKVCPNVEYYSQTNIESGVYAGDIAWVSDAVNHMEPALSNGFEIVVADYTTMDGKHAVDGWYAKPATMYAISKNTDYPEEAATLLDFLLNSPEMAVLQGVEKGVPLSSAAQNTLIENDMLEGIQYEASLCMEEAGDTLGQMNPFVENADLIDAFIDACNLVVYDKASPEEAAKELYNAIRSGSY